MTIAASLRCRYLIWSSTLRLIPLRRRALVATYMPRAPTFVPWQNSYLIPITIHSRSVSCSTLVSPKPVLRIQPQQSAPL